MDMSNPASIIEEAHGLESIGVMTTRARDPIDVDDFSWMEPEEVIHANYDNAIRKLLEKAGEAGAGYVRILSEPKLGSDGFAPAIGEAYKGWFF